MPEGPPAKYLKLDDEGYVVLSQRDIDRIAEQVAQALRPTNVGKMPDAEDSYVPVRRNPPERPMSEY